MDISPYLADAVAHRLSRLITHRAAHHDERQDVGIACIVFDIDPAVDAEDHPLADLYRALVLCNEPQAIVYLSQLHCSWLVLAIQVLEERVNGTSRRETSD